MTSHIEELEARRLLSAGDVDPSFGTGGHVTANVDYESRINALLPLGDGSGDMLVIGRQAIKKIDATGTIDATFGTNGVLTPLADVSDVEILGDGKILVTTSQQIARYDASGTIDTTFSSGGSRFLLGMNLIGVDDMAIQPDGKIIVQGLFDPPARINRIVRLNANGSADNTFTPFDYNGGRAQMRAQADGKILLGGKGLSVDGRLLSILRLNADGGIDESFGDIGFWGNNSGNTVVQDFVLDAQGRIVTLALVSSGVLMLGRLSATGVVDQTFGGVAAGGDHQTEVEFGVIENGPISTSNQFPRVTIAPDGKIIAHDSFHLARLNADGTVDAGFGRVVTLFVERNVYGMFMNGVVPMPNGGMYVAAQDGALPAERGNIYRLQADGTPAGPISLFSGMLSVAGTDADDWIDLQAPPNTILATPQILATMRSGFGRVFDTADVTLVSIDAGAGNDVVYLKSTALKASTVSGGDGDDSIIGSAADDSISGNAGRDNIEGLGGNDRLAGNGSRDKLSGGLGNDRLFGGSSGDWLAGQGGDDQLYGEGGNDRLAGGDGEDLLRGSAGDDTFFTAGDNAIDQLFGDGGRDVAMSDDDDVRSSIELLLG